MPSRVHVFTGPTLPAADVHAVLPTAVVHPPAAGGDLLRLDAVPGDVVVLVDGALAAGNAVRHKEILALLDAGVEVWGAGALGALRAAELQACGMRAHGRVARLFLRGALEGDDEIAVDATAPSAVALVDVRATCRAACRSGLVDPETTRELVAAAQALPPARRSYEEVVGRAVDAGLDADMAWRFESFARDHAVRLTRDDAFACLQAVRRSRAAAPRPRSRGVRSTAATAFTQSWREQTAGAQLAGGFVADSAVLTFCRLVAVDYPAFQRRVALRTLAALATPEVRPGEREGRAMVREFAEARGLDVDSLVLWQAERGLSREELLAHLRREQAIALLLQALHVDPHDESAVDAALAEVVAEHARRRGFVPPGSSPSWERTWLSAAEIEGLSPEQRIARLAARSFHAAPGVSWRQPLVQELKIGGAYRVAREAVMQARQFAAEDGTPPADDEAIGTWFRQRWGVRDRFDLALLDRGFDGLPPFLAAARGLYAFDRATTTYRELRCLGRRPAAATS